MSSIVFNASVAEGPASPLMGNLLPVLARTITLSGMPKTLEEQNAFIRRHSSRLQSWTFENLASLKEAADQLPVSPTLRYGRNLVMHVKVGEKSSICIFLHRLNTETPKHWHSDKETKISALAFAAILNKDVFETRWPVEIEGRKFVQLSNSTTQEAPVGELAPIAADYGVHQISNKGGVGTAATLFEIYFEEEDLNSLDVPVPVLDSLEEHFVDTIPCKWLPDFNLEATARKEEWPLADASELESSKIFMVVNGETTFVPLEKARDLVSSGQYLILQGPGERLLLVKRSA